MRRGRRLDGGLADQNGECRGRDYPIWSPGMLMSPPKETEIVALGDDEAKRTRHRRAFWRVPVQFALMLAALAAGYVGMEQMTAARPDRPPRVFQPTIYAVEAVTATLQDNRPTIALFGEVQAPRNVDIRPQVAGEIVSVHPDLRVGQRVEAGTVIAEIDRFDYEGALAEAEANLAQAEGALAENAARIAAEREQLAGAEEQLELARNDLERARSLSERGAATAQQLDERRLVVSQREQAVSQRRNNLVVEEAQRVQQQAGITRLEWLVRQAERNLANTVLRAPFSGVVSAAAAEPGRVAGSADVVASLYDDRRLEARFTLTNAQYGRLSASGEEVIGRPLEATWTVGTASFAYSGVIDRVGATVAADLGGVELFARLDAGDHALPLRPGAFLEITVPDRLYAESFRLPEAALFDGSHVFAIVDGALERRQVQLSAFTGDEVIIANAGQTELQPGEQVLTTRLTEADEGLPVRIAGEVSPDEIGSESATPEQSGPGERRSGGRFGGRGAMRAFGG